MSVFDDLFDFFWWLLDMTVSIGSYSFSLGGAIIFAGICIITIGVLRFLFGVD